MIIKDIEGEVLYESRQKTIRKAVEEAVENGIRLSRADLSRGNFSRARLDGIKAPGASFWGARLDGADISGADLRACDFRGASLYNVCFAEGDCVSCDFSGAFLKGAVFRDTDISDAVFTALPFFICQLSDARGSDRAIYRHKGEKDIKIGKNPLHITGLSQDLWLFNNRILWGELLIGHKNPPRLFLKDWSRLHAIIAGNLLCPDFAKSKDTHT